VKIHLLTRRQLVPCEHEKVFAFFEDAHNLSRITPPEMGFQIITPGPIAMREGALIDYVVRIGPLSIRWTTLITQYDPPYAFVDVQLKGPYSYWHHYHQFKAVEGGTEISDTVHYALPAGPVGNLVHWLFVRRQLNRIFNHRREVIEKLFAEHLAKESL
jgi:ligand-binding SRPBCC domain-containing protein